MALFSVVLCIEGCFIAYDVGSATGLFTLTNSEGTDMFLMMISIPTFGIIMSFWLCHCICVALEIYEPMPELLPPTIDTSFISNVSSIISQDTLIPTPEPIVSRYEILDI